MSGHEPRLTVAVIVQQGVFKSALCAALEQCPGFAAFGLAAVPEQAFTIPPSIVLLDLDFQPHNHRELLRRIYAHAPDAKVCVLAYKAVPTSVRQCLTMGACGFILKDCSLEELERALRTLARGDIFVDPRVAGVLFKEIDHRVSERKATLSDRETDVIRLIGLGLTNRQIATRLDLSEKTIKNHVSHIFRKLKITARTQAAIHAISNNLVKAGAL